MDSEQRTPVYSGHLVFCVPKVVVVHKFDSNAYRTARVYTRCENTLKRRLAK